MKDSPELLRIIFVTVTSAVGIATLGAALALSSTIPSREIPVPDSVSPAMQALIAAPGHDDTQTPRSTEDWRVLAASWAAADQSRLVGLPEHLGVRVSPIQVAGVPCFSVEPREIRVSRRNQLLIGVHGGGFLGGAGESGLLEAVEMAGLAHFKVLAIDYRRLPDYPFPAALDDVMAVWRVVSRRLEPARIGVFGSSAGGGLVLSFVQRAQHEGLLPPGALMVGTPWSDLTKTGDSYFTNAGLDDRLIRYEGILEGLAKLYANGRNLKDPLLSPVYGDFKGFPPTFLVTGTRDLFLSNTTRVALKLAQERVPTELDVEEGQSHADFLLGVIANAPESSVLYSRIERFFDRHLGR
jgi:monoterpene epsilon-lactone hydrolase